MEMTPPPPSPSPPSSPPPSPPPKTVSNPLNPPAPAPDAPELVKQLSLQLDLLRRDVRILNDDKISRLDESSAVILGGLTAAFGGTATLAPTKRAHGIHMVLTLRATNPNTSTLKAAGWLSLSLLIIMVQCIVLFVIVLESSHPRCSASDECPAGEWCAPTIIYGLRDPGACNDCFTASDPKDEGQWAGVGDAGYWEEAAAHCLLTDNDPLRCDHLVRHRNNLSGGGLVVLIFAAALSLIPTVSDLDQAEEEKVVMATRRVFSGGVGRLPRALLYVSHRLRVFVVPALVVSATASLLLSNDEFSAQSFLLDGMSIGFASNVDDLISFCVIDEEERQRVEEVVEEAVREAGGWKGTGWRRNRLYGFVLATTLMLTVVYCEELMPYLGDEGGGIGRAPCNDISNVATGAPFWIGVAALITMTIFNERNANWKCVVQDLLCGVSVIFVFSWMSPITMFLQWGTGGS